MMRLLADYHHADLAHAHQLTFGRFGSEVVFPYGMEWYEQSYWAFEVAWAGDTVARQYLVGIWGGAEPDADGLVRIVDSRHPGYTLTGITLDAARATRWDWVMATVPANAHGLRRLARETGAMYLMHVGNQWGNEEAFETRPDAAIMTTTSDITVAVPHVVVHQEFSLDDFRHEPPSGFGEVASFVNCFQENVQPCSHGGVSNPRGEYGAFEDIARSADDLHWSVYGAIGTGEVDEFTRGPVHGTPALGDAMRASGVIWHAKHWSDGFGHVVHNAFAVGRPVFGYEAYYRDKLAGPLWVDGVTSFDVDRHGRDATLAKIRELRDNPDLHAEWCAASAARFREVVDFDADAEKVAELIGAKVPA